MDSNEFFKQFDQLMEKHKKDAYEWVLEYESELPRNRIEIYRNSCQYETQEVEEEWKKIENLDGDDIRKRKLELCSKQAWIKGKFDAYNYLLSKK